MATTMPLEPAPSTAAFEVSKNTTWRRFRRHKVAVAAAIVLVLMILFAAVGHLFYPVDPNAIDNVNWTGYPVAMGVGGHPLRHR
jgi:hypothetical protein